MSDPYRVLWHPAAREDFAPLDAVTVDTLVRSAHDRLARAPQHFGQPLKGTTHLLWRMRWGDYRLVYTIRQASREVWVLGSQRRDIVYRASHLQRLTRLAAALHHHPSAFRGHQI